MKTSDLVRLERQIMGLTPFIVMSGRASKNIGNWEEGNLY